MVILVSKVVLRVSKQVLRVLKVLLIASKVVLRVSKVVKIVSKVVKIVSIVALREAFIKKKIMKNSIIGLTPPLFSAKIMGKKLCIFWDTRPLFEHFGDFFLFYPLNLRKMSLQK